MRDEQERVPDSPTLTTKNNYRISTVVSEEKDLFGPNADKERWDDLPPESTSYRDLDLFMTSSLKIHDYYFEIS